MLNGGESSPTPQLLSTSPNDGLQESQTMFATQAPPKKMSHGVGILTHYTGSRTGTLLSPSDESAQVLAPPPCSDLSNLHGKQRGAVKEGTTFLPSSNDQSLPDSGRRNKPSINHGLLDILKQVEQEKITKLVSMVAAPALPSIGSSIDVPIVPVSAVEQHPPSPTTVEPAGSPPQEDLSVSSTKSSKPSSQKDSESTVPQVTKQSEDGSTSLKRRKCISKRDVTIGKEQEELLSRDDCKANIANSIHTLTV